MKIEKAIKFFDDEILMLNNAPKLNGCEMTEEWKEQLEICEMAKSAIEKQAEIERLEKELSTATNHITRLENQIERLLPMLKTKRAEAIKEFWNKLQGIAYQSGDWSHGEHPMVVELDDAEEIYDEMVGEQE